jgi:hypothetical protein
VDGHRTVMARSPWWTRIVSPSPIESTSPFRAWAEPATGKAT